jgi:hypothetical protein
MLATVGFGESAVLGGQANLVGTGVGNDGGNGRSCHNRTYINIGFNSVVARTGGANTVCSIRSSPSNLTIM